MIPVYPYLPDTSTSIVVSVSQLTERKACSGIRASAQGLAVFKEALWKRQVCQFVHNEQMFFAAKTRPSLCGASWLKLRRSIHLSAADSE